MPSASPLPTEVDVTNRSARQAGKIQITDGTYDAGVDFLGYLVAIEIEHHKVHEEVFYFVSDIDTDVDTAPPKYWHIKTPDSSIRFHVKVNIETDTGGLVELFENPTTTDDGVALTPYNADRNSSNVSSVEFYRDPTVGADGTRLQVARIGAGRDKKLGGVARPGSEWILKQNEQYLIKITPDADNAEVTINIEGYEVS